MTQRVFVGYAQEKDIAFQVCEYSIKRFNEDIHVTPLVQDELHAKKKFIGERLIS